MTCDSVIRGSSLGDVSMRNILKLEGSAGGAMAGLQKACSGGYGQVSGEDTSSDNDRMSYRHTRRGTITESPADVRGRYRLSLHPAL